MEWTVPATLDKTVENAINPREMDDRRFEPMFRKITNGKVKIKNTSRYLVGTAQGLDFPMVSIREKLTNFCL